MALLLFLTAAAFTALNGQVSAKTGRLSTVPNYDDVVYLNKASEIYFLGRKEGAGSAAASFFTQYLHAPFAVANALAGFFIFGPNVKAIYLMLTLVVFAYVALVAWVGRGLPILLRWALVFLALAFPFATTAAEQFRPDPLWAIVLGAGSVFFLAAERPFEGWKPSLLYGLALGLVLVTKPSTFAMSFLVMGGSWLLAALAAGFSRRAEWGVIFRGLAVTASAALVVAGWYCLPHASAIFNYFYENSFGANREVWAYHGAVWNRWLYYFQGVALASNLGGFLFPLVLACVAGAIRDISCGDLFQRIRGGAFLWMLAGLVLVNSAFGMKSPFLGGSLYGFLIFAGLWQIARLLRWGYEQEWWKAFPHQLLAALVLLSIAACGYSYSEVCVIPPATRKAQKAINRGVLNDLLRETRGRRASVLITASNPVVGEYLAMEARARGRTLDIQNAAFVRDSAQILDQAATMDFVILRDPKTVGSSGDHIPGDALQSELIGRISGSPDWHLVGRYSDLQGQFAYLYRNLRVVRR